MRRLRRAISATSSPRAPSSFTTDYRSKRPLQTQLSDSVGGSPARRHARPRERRSFFVRAAVTHVKNYLMLRHLTTTTSDGRSTDRHAEAVAVASCRPALHVEDIDQRNSTNWPLRRRRIDHKPARQRRGGRRRLSVQPRQQSDCVRFRRLTARFV